MRRRKRRRIIRVCAVCQDEHTLCNGRLQKSVYDQALIQVALIGDGASEELIPKSSQILSKCDLDKINSGSTHTFCTHNIKNPS